MRLKRFLAFVVAFAMVMSITPAMGIFASANEAVAAFDGVEYASLSEAVAAASAALGYDKVEVELLMDSDEDFTLDGGIVYLTTGGYNYTGDATVENAILISDCALGSVVCESAVTNADKTRYGYSSLTTGVDVVEGAQVRIGDGADSDGKVDGKNSGLRFIAEVDQNETLASYVYEYYNEAAAEYADGYEIGMEIIAEGSESAVDVPATLWQEAGAVFTAALTDLAEGNYNRRYTANAYVEFDGLRFESETSSTRSIYQVASGLLSRGDGANEMSKALVNVLNAYVNQTGVRLTLTDSSDTAALKARLDDKKGGYTGDAFFTVGDTCYRNGAYEVELTAVGKSVINTKLFNDYVRINNNNSQVKLVTGITDKGNGCYTVTFDYADLSGGTRLINEAVTLSNGSVTALVPEGVAFTGSAKNLELVLKSISDEESDVEAGEGEELDSFDIHVNGLAEENVMPVIITLKEMAQKGLNRGNLKLYHVEDGVQVEMEQVDSVAELTKHNQFAYEPLDGTITVALASFSEVALVVDEENAWNGEFDYSWYNTTDTSFKIANADQLAAFGRIVGGMAKDDEGNFIVGTDSDGDGLVADSFEKKTVMLTSDINLGDAEAENDENKVFYPIGYYNNKGIFDRTGVVELESVTSNVNSFSGTFDGNGHTIKNFYQNTWEMFGDYNSGYSGTPNYYKDAMGLFGYVYNGTVKNLTVDNFSSDGEFTPTGVIAAYAAGNSTFENISVVNCNPRVYNTGNGGIIGIGGDSENESAEDGMNDTTLTLKNITVDQSNKISALWGSWDVACGGLMGMFRGYSKVDLTNCHVAAQIDVNNDVCANYQYYWYRYAGMFIGSVRRNTTDTNGYTVAYTDDVTAKDCTYTYGNWNEYWYCELVANSLASYTHDHQFSRLTKIASVSEIQDENGNWDTQGNFVIPNEDNTSATCYHIFKNSEGNLYQHLHDVADESNTDIYETTDLNGDGELNDLKEDRVRYYIPFGQLMTGNGWGVKAEYEYEGMNEVKDGTVLSGEKFAAVGTITTYTPGDAIRIGDLFKSTVADEKLSKTSIFAAVSPATEDGTVSATYAINFDNWENGTLTFAEDSTGTAKVVITDYFYCTKTVITLANANESSTPENKFAANDNLTFTHTTEGGTIEKTLGDIFTAVSGVTIDSINVAVNVTPAVDTVNCEYNKNTEDWTKSTLVFTGTGDVTITITDGELCNTATAIVTITEPEDAEKFKANDVEPVKLVIGETSVIKSWNHFFTTVDGVTIGTVEVTVTTETAGATATVNGDNITFNGAGTYTVKITDNNFCIPTTATFTVEEPTPVQKFETKLTGDFLYRVGNAEGSTVALDSLFKLADETVPLGNISVTIDPVDNTGASGAYTANATWKNGTIQFSGTGIVKVTITDDLYCLSTELFLEVVDAKNIIDTVNGSDGTNIVLLSDVSGGLTSYKNCIVYGNGFTYSLEGASNAYNGGSHGVITISDTTLDNIVVIGDIYETYAAYTKQDSYYLAAVSSNGNSVIQNCYIANCSTPVRIRGNTLVKDTTLYGGTVANLVLNSNTATLENVTTVNYNDGREVIGFGIVVHPDVDETSNAKIVLNGSLKQYNFLAEGDKNSIADGNAQTLFANMFENDYSAFQFEANGTKYVNTGILSLSAKFGRDSIKDNTDNGYDGMTASYNNVNGYIYTLPKEGNKVDNNYAEATDAHKSTIQGDYLPSFDYSSFSLNDQEVSYDGEDDKRYLYYDSNSKTVEGYYQTSDIDGALTLDLEKITTSISKYTGVVYTPSVKYVDADGETQTETVTLDVGGSGKLLFTVYDNVFYNEKAQNVEKSVERTFEMSLNLTIEDTKINNASITITNNSPTGEYTDTTIDGSKNLSINPLNAITVTDCDENGNAQNVELGSNVKTTEITYTDQDSKIWSGTTTITVTYTDGRILTIVLGPPTGSAAGTKTITYSNDGTVKTASISKNACTARTWEVKSYSFTGNNGVTVTDNTGVTYIIEANTSGGCVTPDTLVTLADGSQKRIDSLTGDEILKVWDFEAGEYTTAPIAVLRNHGLENNTVITLEFDNGTVTTAVNEHGYYDVEARRFVAINGANAEDYVGHSFVFEAENGYSTAVLEKVTVEEKEVEAWSILTAYNYNFIADSAFSITSSVGGLEYFMPYENDENLKIDAASMQADIEKYGLFTYEEFKDILTEEQFEAINMPQIKVSVGKGYITMEELMNVIEVEVLSPSRPE